MSDTLIAKTACELVELLEAREIEPGDLLDALEARISDVDGPINALPTLCFERARAAVETARVQGGHAGPLFGLPVAIKDLADVSGVRSTQGSKIYEHAVPETSDILVERIEARGGVVYAKSNTPEFGAGANTFNDVFGATRNPWDTRMSAAGSSGGAAAALATGAAWLAHGSDLGGSLRNPASFCGVVGMRPSPGRVARTPSAILDDTLSVDGPMARTVADLALFLDAMTGEHAGDPISLPSDGTSYLAAAHDAEKPLRVAFSPDLGITPVDAEVAEIIKGAAEAFAASGIVVEEAAPDLSGVHECFNALRAVSFATGLAPLLKDHRDMLKPEVVWNIEAGLKLSCEDIARAERQRVEYCARRQAFFETYDILLTPATIVPPFPVEQRYVESCNGVQFDNYVHWLSIAYAVTIMACPSIAIPAGFTEAGLPVGIQVVANAHDDAGAIRAAAHLERVLGLGAVTPMTPRVTHAV
ncbi:MAG: amidase family protein [Pseudomonadota bacterium]